LRGLSLCRLHVLCSRHVSPCGEGTKTWRKHEMRIHRRLIDLGITDQRVMRQIMRIQIPDDVAIEMQMTSR
jgi:small subunit ribosomal protein S10